MPRTVRVSFTVPEGLDDDLRYLSRRTGVTRSALLVSLLSEPLHDLRGLVEAVPDNPTPEQVVRARGASLELVEERVGSLRKLGDDLFSK